mgnify:CR=1 FL=1
MSPRRRFSPSVPQADDQENVIPGIEGMLNKSRLFNRIDSSNGLDPLSKRRLRAALSNIESQHVIYAPGESLDLKDGEIIIVTRDAKLRTESPKDRRINKVSEGETVNGNTFTVRAGAILGEVGGLGLDHSLRTVGLTADREFEAIRIPNFLARIRAVQAESTSTQKKQIEAFIQEFIREALLVTTRRLNYADEALSEILDEAKVRLGAAIEGIVSEGTERTLSRMSKTLISRGKEPAPFNFDRSTSQGSFVVEGGLRIQIHGRTLGTIKPGQTFAERAAVQKPSNTPTRPLELPPGFTVTPQRETTVIPFNVHDTVRASETTHLLRDMLTQSGRRLHKIITLAANLKAIPEKDRVNQDAMTEPEEEAPTQNPFARLFAVVVGDFQILWDELKA